jgi:hypothetical protein
MLSVRLQWNKMRVVTSYSTWQETFTGRYPGAKVYLGMEYGEDSGLDDEDRVCKRALGEVEPMNLDTIELYEIIRLRSSCVDFVSIIFDFVGSSFRLLIYLSCLDMVAKYISQPVLCMVLTDFNTILLISLQRYR